MLFGWRFAVMLLLLPAVTEAQSGDGDSDMEPRISCTSHIMVERCNLTCILLEGRHDDDEDDDTIEKMTLCFSSVASSGKWTCMETSTDTFSSKELKPLMKVNLTVHLKRGGPISQKVELMKIIKPMSPRVLNITFSRQANQAVIRIQTPYNKDYLKVENQLFQLQIWTSEKPMHIQNISAQDFMTIDMSHLKKNTKYHVKVRAIPQYTLQGTWSEWSETFTFLTPTFDDENWDLKMIHVIVSLVSVLVVTSVIIIFWKNKIFTYMWPSIPHPKQTLVQICKQNNSLLLTFRPEVFSALKVYPPETTACEETEPAISFASSSANSAQSSEHCSTQSSDCRSTTSASTEELELSALLSRSSSETEDSLPRSSPSPVDVLQLGEGHVIAQPDQLVEGNEVEVFGVNQQEEAYVTMSSFYKIK